MSGRHYRALASMHQELQERIDAQMKSPMPNDIEIAMLKRMKLGIKDRMRRVLDDGTRVVPMAPRRPHQRASISSDA